ncbi:remorin family protein [Striga asiatica]|uniref:Remorin family protein n=1 Tax=Striga asiatica TaxID=4170 RepID=A0A5A7PVH2_STRAF|nr:remorin family protein [Striga asiatica]
MEYERIHKVQTGIISPSKLRMKLIGSQRKKDGSNCNSSRTSPSRLEEDSEFVNNSLLADRDGNSAEEALNLEVEPVKSDITSSNGDSARTRAQPESTGSSSVHPVRTIEDENLDYDSTSSFEFHKGDHKPPHQHAAATRALMRPVSSKWNDAEKWIMSRQNVVQPSTLKRSNSQNQGNRTSGGSMVRVAPELAGLESKALVKRVDFVQPALQTGPSKFGLGPTVDLCPESKDLMEVDDVDSGLPSTKSVTDENNGPAIRSVSMRDMGTEMTPIPSQEPSRSPTPVSSTTPLRSPTSSIPSTPRRGAPAPTPTEHDICNQTPQDKTAEPSGRKELSEQEMKLRTRREIVALGVQLGKMNIAAWASKDEKGISGNENVGDDDDEAEQVEYAKRAAAWEEAEKSKHSARRGKAQIEQMRAQAQAKMVKKVALARQKSEEKRASAEAKKNRQAEKTAAQAEYIRLTGRIPSSSPFHCCGWL